MKPTTYVAVNGQIFLEHSDTQLTYSNQTFASAKLCDIAPKYVSLLMLGDLISKYKLGQAHDVNKAQTLVFCYDGTYEGQELDLSHVQTFVFFNLTMGSLSLEVNLPEIVNMGIYSAERLRVSHGSPKSVIINQLEGSIEDLRELISELSYISRFHLVTCALSPKFDFSQRLPHLLELGLVETSVTVDQMSRLPIFLVALTLSGLRMQILPDISYLSNLRELVLSSMPLLEFNAARIPATIERLYYENNGGIIGLSLQEFPELGFLSLKCCDLTMAQITTNENLQSLNVIDCELSVVPGARAFPRLQALYISRNAIEAADFSQHQLLRELEFSDCCLREFPDLSQISCLTRIVADNNDFCDFNVSELLPASAELVSLQNCGLHRFETAKRLASMRCILLQNNPLELFFDGFQDVQADLPTCCYRISASSGPSVLRGLLAAQWGREHLCYLLTCANGLEQRLFDLTGRLFRLLE